VNELGVKVVYRAERGTYYVRWCDPETGRERQRSCKTRTRRDAERVAGELRADLREGREVRRFRIAWQDFRQRFEREKLSGLSSRSYEAYRTALNRLEGVLRPRKLLDVTAGALSRFQTTLRGGGLHDATIACYLRHIKGALNWGGRMGLIGCVPKIDMPKRSKGVTKDMRCRPITTEEFGRMLDAVPLVRNGDAEKWQRFLRGLWLSGLRISEALALSWEEDAPLSVCLNGPYPKLRIWAEGEKAHQDRLLPITPDFGQYLLDVAPIERRGLVFGIEGPVAGKPMSVKRAVRTVSTIGRNAGIVVNKATGKFASAHDLRRAFATRWASRLMPARLQRLMRHRSIETTMRYYVGFDADQENAELWEHFG
jgi:integrase